MHITLTKSTYAIILFIARLTFVLTCLVFAAPHTVRAESSKLNENEIKAAYLYNFAKFVEWPKTAMLRENSPLVICIVGHSPLNEVIESLAGKSIKNHKLVIRQFSRIEDLNECHLLFINAAANRSASQILTAIAPRAILTVSDHSGFAAAGGIIEFVPTDNKIRFKINNRAAQNINLRISSHLLRLATTIIE